LADLDESYPGGLPSYLSKAQRLLLESAEGYNPFDEFTAQVPEGQVLSLNDDTNAALSMADAEALGWTAAHGLVFVLVAGGLGERLGYSGIKLSLDTEICTETCYLEFYARYIRAVQYKVQQRSDNSALRIPLVIMTSGDTDAATRQLLIEHKYFELDESQVTIVTQDKVAALRDGAAGLALADDTRWTIDTKPHGHGDVHQLLARAGLVDEWERSGKSHVVFLQDTNALVVNSVIPTLGVSVQLGLHMNSICIPRLAGEAAGAIARLEYVPSVALFACEK
jgi:UDP-sugar pyrophosphorylase